MSEVLVKITNSDNLYLFWCPGCKCCHQIDTERWIWDGDDELPTVSPSILIKTPVRCHLFIRDGKLQFLSDCEHEYRSQTIPMVPVDQW